MKILIREKIEELLTTRFKEIAFKRGFVQESEYPHAFRFVTDGRIDFITYTGVKTYQQFFYTMPSVSRYIKTVEDFWIDLANKINIQVNPYFQTLNFSPLIIKPEIIKEEDYDRVYYGYKAIANEEGVDNFMELAIDLMDNYLFPATQKYLDLREIDKFVNAEIKYGEYVQGFLGTTGTEFKRLIIAKLVGNPIYNNLVDFFRSSYDWHNEKGKEKGSEYLGNYPEVFETLFERLKNVKPLANPILD